MFPADPVITQALARARRERYEREASQSRLLKAARTASGRQAPAASSSSLRGGSSATTPTCCGRAAA